MISQNEGLTEFDLWRLADCLPVTVAASLIAGHSPNDRFLSADGDYRYLFDALATEHPVRRIN